MNKLDTLVVRVHRKNNGGCVQAKQFVRLKSCGSRSVFTDDGTTWWVTETPDSDLVLGGAVTFVQVDGLFEHFLQNCRMDVSLQSCRFEWLAKDCQEAFFFGTIDSVQRR